MADSAGAPRVALFTDTYHEINGVALTSRQFVQYARRRGLPFLCVRGDAGAGQHSDGTVIHRELARSRFSVGLDRGLRYDPLLWRSAAGVARAVAAFKPDIVHVVSPGDVSTIGVYVAKKLKVPLAISWHTNLHEFGAMRLTNAMEWLPEAARRAAGRIAETQGLRICLAFYRMGDVLYAPNEELVAMLREGTGKPVFPMKRGIDTQLFDPARRTLRDGVARIGYVGRITPEKSVRFLRSLEQGLLAAGAPPFRFLIVGDGSELGWLRGQLRNADFRGIRRGEELSEDYANMDVFVFPSRTDTFGNVVLEALASGVPAVVTSAGGPKYIVKDGISGLVAGTDAEFIVHTSRLLRDAALREKMARAAREQAYGEAWDDVFAKVYEGYAAARRGRVSAT